MALVKRFFTNHGLYLFPDGKVYVAKRPLKHGILWTFWTIDNWTLAAGDESTWVRFPDGKWMKRGRRTQRNRLGTQVHGQIDSKVLFTGTVLAKKVKGKRLPQPDSNWFWKMDFRARRNYK